MKNNYLPQYQERAKRLYDGITHTAVRAKDELNLRQFCFTMANFRTLMPEYLADKTQEQVFIDLLCCRGLAPLDQDFPEKVYDIQFTGDFFDIVSQKDKPSIFCTYHLGSYRAIIGALARMGYDFTLVVDNGVFEKQKEYTERTVKEINELCGVKSDFEMLNAESFDAAMRMVNNVKKGHSLIAYIDGNTGTGGVHRRDERMLKVDFFGRKMFARQGIAHIAFLTGVPIVPVISYRNAESDIVLHFYDKINPLESSTRKEFCATTTQLLYTYLEDMLKQYPLQWEGWLYVHKYFDTESLGQPDMAQLPATISVKDVRFNDDRYGLFVFGPDYYLLDGSNYRTFLIGEEEFNLLRPFWVNRYATRAVLTEGVLDEAEIQQKTWVDKLRNSISKLRHTTNEYIDKSVLLLLLEKGILVPNVVRGA
jgi:lauroyl/myristoyl acyltransferase